ncbi:SurA N-terminal domain-containing protein [Nitrosomonas ureae]|uniref:Periplasmic chaperone PpiD n=1 Tax=Nitrosomonas ureae TaxID=44577 RepID=A0A1H2EVC9_9PROT|nr:SurA N-terminal domain-containing protein [Nitrosomonas ureae]ALQ51519.1 peptidylprolyl isomerase [Nitrosomonas ureae]SDT99067.1 peptidyl-prolyl cis-trans isomerase D [Nitrosomonas ureae]
MFDLVNRKKRVVQVILGLAVLPFMFWGVESYRNDGSEGYVAVVEGEEISRREYEQALRDHHERVRAMLGANFDSAMLDNFEVKNSVLERLIQQRLLYQEAVKNGFVVLDSQLIKTIQDVQAFQKNNKFSKQQYEKLLLNQDLTPAIFELRVRNELLLQQLLDGYSENAITPRSTTERVQYLSEVRREISQSKIAPDQFLSQVIPEEADIAAYYEQHKIDFDLPERAKVEYLVLSLDKVAKNEFVSDEAINTYFSEHQSEFGQSEERKASHILISVSTDAPEEEKRIARDKVERILEQVKQDPDQFAEIAKEHSDDPGSAMRGGDLGFFGHGVMVKSFEDKIFSMQLDEISDIVETDFGLHIIKLTAIKEERHPDLEEVREQIENTLKVEMVKSVFGEIVEDFSNVVYEQGESLHAAAEKFELIIEKSDWITRDSKEPAILANENLLSAIFSDDVISNNRNTEAIEVNPDTFVSARIIEYKPATSQSLAVVKDEIVEKLKKEMAVSMAVAEGQERLARLQAGEVLDDVAWDDAQLISYMQPQGLDHEALRAIFRAEVDELPAYVGAVKPEGGFNLIRISKVVEPGSDETTTPENFAKQLQQMITQEEISSYLAAIRQRYDVKIKQNNF